MTKLEELADSFVFHGLQVIVDYLNEEPTPSKLKELLRKEVTECVENHVLSVGSVSLTEEDLSFIATNQDAMIEAIDKNIDVEFAPYVSEDKVIFLEIRKKEST